MKRFLIIFLLFVVSCNSNEKFNDLYNSWINKEIIFHNDLEFYNNNCSLQNKYKIVNYIDSLGCLSCKSQLPLWKDFISNLKENISVIIFMHPKMKNDAKIAIGNANYNYPVCIDLNDSLNKLNHFPSDERFHCFLLDENNRVILIGNPVQNPKIKDLYIRTICERLGIDTTNINIADNQNENRFSFGRFPFSDTMKTQFVLKNDSLPELKIDSIFTSCECTTTKIDKSVIKKSDSAIVSVSFKTDKPEEFMREVYVKTNYSEKPIVYTVDGVVF